MKQNHLSNILKNKYKKIGNFISDFLFGYLLDNAFICVLIVQCRIFITVIIHQILIHYGKENFIIS
ncbi:hypothetical protein CGC58_07050 [Capnocytophaga stomatis]|uniref:Uncharacterized protein n=1 Tax=Capnocytophaga stomatis TaxID=1848904 RepID=A0A250FWP7_9FLAO|nr:hypothetical protein CGC58_07050 [Capnocytophaga stomatis]